MSLTSEVQKDICFICNQSNGNYRLLYECATYQKKVHRRCTHTPTGSIIVYCTRCLPEKSKDGETKRKSMINRTSIQSRTSSTVKSRVVKPQSRRSNNNNIGKHSTTFNFTGGSAYSSSTPSSNSLASKYTKSDTSTTEQRVISGTSKDIINKTSKKENCLCPCHEKITTSLHEWEKTLQAELQIVSEKIKLTIASEVSTLHRSIDAITDTFIGKHTTTSPSTTSLPLVSKEYSSIGQLAASHSDDSKFNLFKTSSSNAPFNNAKKYTHAMKQLLLTLQPHTHTIPTLVQIMQLKISLVNLTIIIEIILLTIVMAIILTLVIMI